MKLIIHRYIHDLAIVITLFKYVTRYDKHRKAAKQKPHHSISRFKSGAIRQQTHCYTFFNKLTENFPRIFINFLVPFFV